MAYSIDRVVVEKKPHLPACIWNSHAYFRMSLSLLFFWFFGGWTTVKGGGARARLRMVYENIRGLEGPRGGGGGGVMM